MNTYSYIVARFMNDVVKNEPVNIGIIVNDHETKTSCGKFVDLNKVKKRVGSSFNTKILSSVIKELEGQCAPEHNLEELSKAFNHKLQFTERRAVKNNTPADALQYAYNRYISIGVNPPPITMSKIRTDIAHSLEETAIKMFGSDHVRSNYEVYGKIFTLKANIGIILKNTKNLLSILNISSADTMIKDALHKSECLNDIMNVHGDVHGSMIIKDPDDVVDKKYYEFAMNKLRKHWKLVPPNEKESHLEEIKNRILV